jgi:hypothetical protein
MDYQHFSVNPTEALKLGCREPKRKGHSMSQEKKVYDDPVTLGINLERPVANQIREAARARGTSVSAYLRALIADTFPAVLEHDQSKADRTLDEILEIIVAAKGELAEQRLRERLFLAQQEAADKKESERLFLAQRREARLKRRAERQAENELLSHAAALGALETK